MRSRLILRASRFLHELLVSLRRGVSLVCRQITHTVVETDDGYSIGVVGFDPRRWYLTLRLSAGNARLRVRRGFHCGGIADVTRKLSNTHGIAVTRLFRRLPQDFVMECVRVPHFVPLQIMLPGTMAELWDGLTDNARNDARKSQSIGFTWQIINDASVGVEFQTKFHAPSITARHAEGGVIASTNEILLKLQSGDHELLRVYLNGEWVGASLNERKPGCYRMDRLGWREGKDSLLRKGIVGALYWASLERAIQLGYRLVSLGGSQPFVDNGLVMFKCKWGAMIDAGDIGNWQVWLFCIDPRNPAVRKYLSKDSLITISPSGRAVVISAGTPAHAKNYRLLSRSVNAWYRLLPEPGDGVTVEGDDLPDALRQWFINEPLDALRTAPAALCVAS
jgi:hypothetical protein